MQSQPVCATIRRWQPAVYIECGVPNMMTNIPWADILPAAVAVTLSPVPIMAVILALFGQHPRQNGLSFLVGWVAGLAALAELRRYSG